MRSSSSPSASRCCRKDGSSSRARPTRSRATRKCRRRISAACTGSSRRNGYERPRASRRRDALQGGRAMRAAEPPRGANSAPAGGGDAAKPRARGDRTSLLEVSNLNSYYGDSHILFDVSLRVDKNEVVALLGRNGAGKSTTLKSLMGVVTPRAGSVMLDGTEIAGRKSHAIAKAGMQLVHEDR